MPLSSSTQLLSVNAYHYVRGGADLMYFEHAKAFEGLGWRNTFFSMHHQENLSCVDSRFFAAEIDYHKPSSYLEKLVHGSRIIWSYEARAKLIALLETRSINIAHVHNIYHHQSPSILAELKNRGIPIVMTAHDLKLACPNNKMMNNQGICERCKGGKVWNVARFRCVQDNLAASALITLESAVHKAFDLYDRYIDRIVAPSKFYREKLIEWGWSPNKIVVIPNFISSIPPVEIVIGGDYFLYFGRLAPEKGLKTLIKAAKLANVKVVLAGTGPEEEYLKALALEINAPITFAGFLSGAPLWSMVNNARAVVLPSEWYENGPMSIIEAFARGKPLIGAMIGGIPELLDDEKNGWGFESGSVIDLARVLALAADAAPSELKAKGSSAENMARTKFSAESYTKAMTELYSSLL